MFNINPAAVGKVLLVAFQLALLILVIKLFELQHADFLNLSVMVFFGFLIHAFLPMRFRLTFFLLLSLASIVLLLGFKAGASVIGLGSVLIGICYLPLGFSTRVALLLLAGGVLATFRVEWLTAPWAETVWPILSAMFMFRLIIYMYDIKHEKGRPDLTRTLSYFFMLPNVLFPLFPVVDYKKFQRNYYNEDSERIYQRGVSWIFRGVIHLLLYRIAYQYLTVDPDTVNGLAAVLQFSFSTFLLYLQVSGSFHMIVGILLLFGFNLPETNHLYFLASSFNDFWRRINIYWKDFMMKVFYYPVYFRVKKLGETKAIIISTLVVFFATWFLHAYQWFWLRGVFLLEWHDALYWTILSFLVIGNSLYETKYGRERKLGNQSRTLLDYAALVCSTLGTFLTMGLLWGMWSSDSMSQWITMWGTTGVGWIVMLLVVPGLFVMSMLLGALARQRKKETSAPARRPVAMKASKEVWKTGIAYAFSAGLIYVLGHKAVYSQLPSGAASTVEAFRVVKLSARDQAQIERGYYENLIGVNRRGTTVRNVFATLKQRKPDDWGWGESIKYTPETGDLRFRALLPNVELVVNRGRIQSNRWGFRDKDYELDKPSENTLRIAILGASYVFGAGVSNGEVFETLFEDRLNKQGGGMHYEVMNFAFDARSVVNQVQVIELDVLKFEPDVLMYFEHTGADRLLISSFASVVSRGIEKLPYDYLRSVVQRAGISDNDSKEVIRNRLTPYAKELESWAYEQIVTTCRENGVTPVWVFLPRTDQRNVKGNPEYEARISTAERFGFFTMTLNGAYGDYSQQELALAAWDEHPNALGHQLIAEKLYRVFTENEDEILESNGEPLLGSAN